MSSQPGWSALCVIFLARDAVRSPILGSSSSRAHATSLRSLLTPTKPTLAGALGSNFEPVIEWRASRAFWDAVADNLLALSPAADAAALALALMDDVRWGSSAASALPDDLKGLRPNLREKMLIFYSRGRVDRVRPLCYKLLIGQPLKPA